MVGKKIKFRYIPDGYEKTIFDIGFAQLAASGIETILIDLDNTVLPYDQSVPDESVVNLFEKIKTTGLSLIVISNNREPRVQHFADAVHCPYVYSAKKPFKSGFQKAVRMGKTTDPGKVCVIGDQFVTDVWGGKRLGFHVIVVDALKRDTEKWFTRFNRKIEKWMLKRILKHFPDLFASLHLAEKR